MIWLVLDTNVVVAALLTPDGLPAQILLMCLNNPKFELCMSGPVYVEYDEVVRRPKFKRDSPQIDAALNAIREKGIWFGPTERIGVCSDPDDDAFLECTEAAAAHFLITGNTRHFPAIWRSTRVLTARQFPDLLA